MPTTENHGPADQSAHWEQLVEQIRVGDPAGMEALYRVFARGVRFYLCRQRGPQELDDKVHDTFLIVVKAIRRGELREPERLMGFVRTVVRRQVAAHIDQAVQSRRDRVDVESGIHIVDSRSNPEEVLVVKQRAEAVALALQSISGRDREILTRFYLLEQTQEEICHEMSLSETQFRLLKSRAKARFGELGKKKLLRSALTQFIVRAKAASAD